LTYREAVAALQARGRFGVRLGLGRTRALLRALGDPHRDVRGALVGGTNGKGSVQALVGAALRASGTRVGQTPKPHLVSYRERILVDGAPIAPPDFVRVIEKVLEAADQVPRHLGPPTEFELVTAAAFTWFAWSGIRRAVVEVGLGGRLDATNVWDGGVAAITNVDWDHMEYLGDTLRAIAREKAAIIKRGNRAVTGATGEPLAVIRRRARRLRVPLDVVEPLVVLSMDRGGLLVEDAHFRALQVGLLGRHQAANAAVALATLGALRAAGLASVPDTSVREGFASARWPGRLELLVIGPDGRAGPASPDGPHSGSPDLVLDGAHNRAGAAALGEALDELAPSLSPGRATLLLGILRDKQVAEMVEVLARSASLRGASVVATAVPGTPRTLAAEDLAGACKAASRTTGVGWSVRAVDSGDDALQTAVGLARAGGGPLIVAGSLYLVGHVRGKLFEDPALLDPED
jgi:dihydrofolate synthase / folylpolyglutamate synthase